MFSIIIPTINRKNEVLRCLESILIQKIDDLEILIIDQNKEIYGLEKYLSKHAGKYSHIYTEIVGLSYAKNLGAKNASGQYLCFVDDDAEFQVDYFNLLRKHIFNGEKIKMFAGALVDPKTGGSLMDRKCKQKESKIDYKNIWYYSCESAMTIEKGLFLECKGFDEEFGLGARYRSCEGTDLLVRVIEKGDEISFYADLVIYHPNKVYSYDQAENERAEKYAYGVGAFYKKNIFYRRNMHLVSWLVYHLSIYLRNAVYYFVADRNKQKYYLNCLKGLISGFLAYDNR